VRGKLTGQIAVIVLRIQNVFVGSFSDNHSSLLFSSFLISLSQVPAAFYTR
jgi:hypothetical protein